MKKRKIINFVLAALLTILLGTKVIHIIENFVFNVCGLDDYVAFFVCYLLVTVIGVIVFTHGYCLILQLEITVGDIWYANNYYKKLLTSIDIIRQYEKARYKTYFTLSGKELEKSIEKYDKILDDMYQYAESIIEFLLKYEKKYLSKNQYKYVLELKNNGVRGTGRG